MQAIIITIGDEILMGQILDTNSRYIARRLTQIGVDVVEMFSIPDRPEEIRKTVDEAMHLAELVIVTGGLGPTKDDITKKVLADYFGARLVMNNEAYGWLEELLSNRALPMNEYNKSQAILPSPCKLLHNYKGTASGMWFEQNGKSLISLPGVPFEMEHLIDTYVVPMLQEQYPHLLLEYRMLRVYDISESELAMRLSNWEEKMGEGLGLAYLPSPGVVKLRITAKGKAVAQLNACYESLKNELKGLRITEGENNTLEKEFGELLKKKGVTVATAESCTGGYIAHLITAVPGSSDYFKGSVVAYANDIKTGVLGVSAHDIEQYGAVSEQVVRQMAEGAKRLMNSDYAISTSGVAGPTGGTPEKPVGTVWIGLATPEKTIARKYVFSFTRERNIAKAATTALELLIDEIGA